MVTQKQMGGRGRGGSSDVEGIQIEKNVPMPEPRPTEPKYPLAKMQIGNSFIVPLHKRNAVSTAARAVARKTGMTFSIRMISETEARVWRTS